MFNRKYQIWWIVLFAVLPRLYGIENPPIGHHAWRQTDTAIMARNFYENGYQLFYPQMNWSGGGYVECEFPIYPFIVSLFYAAFGYAEAWGRLVTILFNVVGLFYLYRLVDEIVSRRAALWAAFFFAILPLNILYGRAIMPESLMITGSIAGIYHYWRWTQTDRIIHWFCSLIGISLAVLIKIPTLYLGLPLGYLSWLRFGQSMWTRGKIWIYMILVFVSLTGWYYYAHQLGIQSGISFGMWSAPGQDKWGNWDLVLSWKYWNKIIFQWWINDWFVTTGFVLVVCGIGLPRKNKTEMLFDFWLAAVIFYYFIVGVGNYVHDYYSFPISLLFIIYMGKTCARYIDFNRSPRWIAGFVCLIAMLTGYISLNSYYQRLKDEKPAQSSEYQLALAVRLQIAADEKILSYSPNGSPIVLNLTYRRGWLVKQNEIESSTYIEKKRRDGARYLVFLQRDFQQLKVISPASIDEITRHYPILEENNDYIIFKL